MICAMRKKRRGKTKSARLPAGGKRGWTAAEARARFGHLLDQASAGHPQRITRRGKTVAVLVAAEETRPKSKKHKTTLLEFFRTSPLAEALAGYSNEEIDRLFARDKTTVPPPIKFD
jgi:prevent-host-death family protein